MVVADIILIVFALLATGVAALVDLKTREVPDWVSYGLIISAIGVRAMHTVVARDPHYIGYAFVGLFSMYLFGMVMFKTKQWGGGDAKLIMGLGIVFATKPYFIEPSQIPFLLILLINILLVGAIYGLFYGAFLAVKNGKKFTKGMQQILRQKKVLRTRTIAISIAIPLLIMAFIIKTSMFRLSLIALAALIILYPYLWIFIKTVEKVCLYKTVPPSKLTEGDWVEQDITINKKVIYKQKNTGIEREDIQKLIKAKIKKVLVKDGIPFTPTFLLGMLLSLWHGGIALLL